MGSREPMQGIHVLLPVWGARYLRQCFDVCIPSLLAPGNLPAVATAVPTTFILMTRIRDMPWIRSHPAWLALAEVCDARLESIDGLLSKAASVVLTLAYVRAIRAVGIDARDIGFVFLVADYVVANGALWHILGRLQSGADAVLAGNFQIVPEAMGPLVAAASPSGGVALSVPPRALVRLALDWLHPATYACVVGETVAHDPNANRMFWRVGPDTLLGRFYLMHMVAIRPQTVDVTIASPCDYSFVPEFCPTGCIETITDSDDYLVVEMQPVSPDQKVSAPGTLDPGTIAESLKEWVTAQHRGNAAYPIVYHVAEANRGLAAATDESARWVAEIDRLLGPSLRPHRHHPYWAGALDHHQATSLYPVDWAVMEAILGRGALPAATGRLRRRLLGRMPQPRPWHPHWTDLRIILKRLVTLADGRSLLIVSAESGRVRTHLIESARTAGARDVVHWEPEEVLEAAAQDGFAPAPASPAHFEAALVLIGPRDDGSLREVSRALVRILADGAHIVVVVSDLSDADARAVSSADVEAIAERIDSGLQINRIETVPAPRWRIAAQAEMMARARATMFPRVTSGRLSNLVPGIACASLSLIANFACLRWALGTGGRRPCSTALFHIITKRRPPTADLDDTFLAMTDAETA